MESKINKAFERWVAKYVKENDNIDYDLIILEDMLAAWNASRIDALDEKRKDIIKIIQNPNSAYSFAELQEKSNTNPLDAIKHYLDIDTELKKAESDESL